MGACFNARVYDLTDDYENLFNASVEASLYEEGHSYSGGIGMLGKGFRIIPTIAKDTKEAHEYICDHHQKWDGAMAMKTQDGKIVIGGWCSE